MAMYSKANSEGGGSLLELHEEADGKTLTVELSGRLAREDYERFVPAAHFGASIGRSPARFESSDR
jgi:hypothetical protein